MDSQHLNSGSNRILVQGISEDEDAKSVENFFKKKKLSGGGPIKNIEQGKHKGEYYITFADPNDADQVLQQKDINFRGQQLQVERVRDIQMSPDIICNTVGPRCIHVTGAGKDADENELRKYFEKRRLSGGGPVQKLVIDQNTGVFITFDNSEDAKRVLKQENLTFKGNQLIVDWAPAQGTEPKPDIINTAVPGRILVTGISESTDQEKVENFFRSKRRSGGGPIQNIVHGENKGSFVITFSNLADAACVLKQKDLTLDGIKLEVSSLGNEENIRHDSTLMQLNDKPILVTGIGENSDRNSVEQFFTKKRLSGGGPIKKIERGPSKDSVIITFENNTDADRVLKQRDLKFGGHTLDIKAFGIDENKELKNQPMVYGSSADDDNNGGNDSNTSGVRQQTRTSKGNIQTLSVDENNGEVFIKYGDISLRVGRNTSSDGSSQALGHITEGSIATQIVQNSNMAGPPPPPPPPLPDQSSDAPGTLAPPPPPIKPRTSTTKKSANAKQAPSQGDLMSAITAQIRRGVKLRSVKDRDTKGSKTPESGEDDLKEKMAKRRTGISGDDTKSVAKSVSNRIPAPKENTSEDENDVADWTE